MPNQPTYPGVYIEEVPSGVRTIAGVATSITAFVGVTERGDFNEPVMVFSMSEFISQFGRVTDKYQLSGAVDDYFRNGGSQAVIVRAGGVGSELATVDLGGGLTLNARSKGQWGNALMARVEHVAGSTPLYNLILHDSKTGATEVYNGLPGPDTTGQLKKRLQSSSLAVLKTDASAMPTASKEVPPEVVNPFAEDESKKYFSPFKSGSDADATDTEIVGDPAAQTGIYALEKTEIFNLLCIPPLKTDGTEAANTTFTRAAKLCSDRRALLLMDRHWDKVADAATGVQALSNALGQTKRNAAVYFPRVLTSDDGTRSGVGAIAGIYARTDVQRGVWKAPAGTEAALNLEGPLSFKLNDGQNGVLNVKALNCLRTFPTAGTVVWGARMLSGADDLADSDYKYVPVRRLTLFIEESLYRGTQWVVFEPNDEPLWAQIRLNVGAFMHTLFRQGAFQGRTPKDAYFVRCDRETNPQADIDRGIVNILVGFAPLKPAEFVFIKIQQISQLAVAA